MSEVAPPRLATPVPAAVPSVASPLTAVGLHKTFVGGDGSELHVLDGVDLRVEPGEAVAVIGASGAGKSTLLHLLGALDRPTAGEVLVEGRAVSGLDEESLAKVRNRHIGFVFQFHHLLSELSALDNVAIPRIIKGVRRAEAREEAAEALTQVGLGDRLTHVPGELSGGEQQRVAIARALVGKPGLLLADEPTGNLDPKTAERVLDLFLQLHEEVGSTLVVVTHSKDLAARFPRKLFVVGGRLEEGT